MNAPTDDTPPDTMTGTPGTLTDPLDGTADRGGRGSTDFESENGESISSQTIFEQRGPIPESELVEIWGIPREALRQARHDHLSEGEHWEKQGRDIVILPAGIATLAPIFEISEKNGPEKKEPAPPAEPETPAPWFVVSVPRNRRLVLIGPECGGQATGRLRVRDNAKFTIGMDCTSKVRPAGQEQTDVYELIGNQPRFRGRW